MKKIKFNVITIVITLILAICVGGIATMFASPGDADDPVVTLSYIQKEILPKLMSCTGGYKLVELAVGDKLICDAGTELILRMGSANIIASEKGGIANVSAGVDLPNGEKMPANSLLVVPVSDNRGIVATKPVIVMVKGDYKIQK